jgi:CheY-like chemotaxis protein
MGPAERNNLGESTVLLIDDNARTLDLLSSLFHGFGVREQIKCESAAAAVEVLKRRPVDLVLVDCSMPDMDGYDLTRWIRRETEAPLRHVPIIMLTGHAAQSQVYKSRDTGASFVVAKPLTPKVLLKRILWLGSDEREFIECDSYVGPDRRVRNFGPPLGMPGRRAGDLSTHVGEPAEANMDQSAIDMLMKPRRVAL